MTLVSRCEVQTPKPYLDRIRTYLSATEEFRQRRSRAEIVNEVVFPEYKSFSPSSDDPSDGETALGLASLNGSLEAVQILVEARADLSASGNKTSLCNAIVANHTHVFRYLLAQGISVNPERSRVVGGYNAEDVIHSNRNRESPLLVAAQSGRTEYLRELLRAGAEVQYCIRIFYGGCTELGNAFALAIYTENVMATFAFLARDPVLILESDSHWISPFEIKLVQFLIKFLPSSPELRSCLWPICLDRANKVYAQAPKYRGSNSDFLEYQTLIRRVIPMIRLTDFPETTAPEILQMVGQCQSQKLAEILPEFLPNDLVELIREILTN